MIVTSDITYVTTVGDIAEGIESVLAKHEEKVSNVISEANANPDGTGFVGTVRTTRTRDATHSGYRHTIVSEVPFVTDAWVYEDIRTKARKQAQEEKASDGSISPSFRGT